MGQEIDFLESYQKATQRNYLQRVCQEDKYEASKVASQFGKDYWDGDRRFGYGGYHYDGRWKPLSEKVVAHYGLKSGDKVLDVGCGKGYFLYELQQLVPGLQVQGIDISEYAITHAKEEVQPFIIQGEAQNLPFKDQAFDFIWSNGTLHNLEVDDLKVAVSEIQRVGKQGWIGVESYRNIDEKINLLYWQLTCNAFFSRKEWVWLYSEWGYQGDYGFIYFE